VAIDKLQREQTLDTYRALARAHDLPERIVRSAVRDTVALARATWPKLLSSLQAPPKLRQVVRERMKTLPLANGK
jgi:serine/threonine-protein kinase HipA